MGRDLRLIALVGALAFVVGCNDDLTDPELNPRVLSSSETESIADDAASAVVAALEAGFGGNVALAGGGSIPFDFVREHTRECPAGGTVTATVSVSGDMDQGSGELTLEGSTTFDECTRGGPDRNVVINGVLTHSGTVTVNGDSRSATFTTTGELTWNVTPGDEGTCSVNFTVTFEDGTRSVSGTVCGREVDRTT